MALSSLRPLGLCLPGLLGIERGTTAPRHDTQQNEAIDEATDWL